jgi:zinc transporter ZupT
MELWWHKAVEQSNWLGISMAVAAGAMLFAVLDPLVPKPPEPQQLLYTAANGSEAEEQQVRQVAQPCSSSM